MIFPAIHVIHYTIVKALISYACSSSIEDLYETGEQTRFKTGDQGCFGNQTQACTLNPSPIDCKWGEWEACSATCGQGSQSRVKIQEANLCGKNCKGKDIQTCTIQKCPIVRPSQSVYCWWGPWSSCTTTCGPGFQTRYLKGGPGCDRKKRRRYCNKKRHCTYEGKSKFLFNYILNKLAFFRRLGAKTKEGTDDLPSRVTLRNCLSILHTSFVHSIKSFFT